MGEWYTRVQRGRNSMNCYRLAAHFIPRSHSCGWLVKRRDPLPSPPSLAVPSSLLIIRVFFLSLSLSLSPAGVGNQVTRVVGHGAAFFSLLSFFCFPRTTKRRKQVTPDGFTGVLRCYNVAQLGSFTLAAWPARAAVASGFSKWLGLWVTGSDDRFWPTASGFEGVSTSRVYLFHGAERRSWLLSEFRRKYATSPMVCIIN
mgnify:CR=1 FL=1